MKVLDPDLLLRAYSIGVFPMSDGRDADEVFWVEPRRRAILPLDGFHLSRSLRKTLRSGVFTVTRDRAFERIIALCAARAETWINPEIEQSYRLLHRLGHAHSIECWREGELLGGLYGVRLGAAFFGESMVSLRRDASKVALAWLVARLKVGGFRLLDCQFMTPHLGSLGAVEVSQQAYLSALSGAVADPAAADPSAGADFGALDRLLADRSAASGGDVPSGWVIAQLLGQTS